MNDGSALYRIFYLITLNTSRGITGYCGGYVLIVPLFHCVIIGVSYSMELIKQNKSATSPNYRAIKNFFFNIKIFLP
jgi:hypothetical protein